NTRGERVPGHARGQGEKRIRQTRAARNLQGQVSQSLRLQQDTAVAFVLSNRRNRRLDIDGFCNVANSHLDVKRRGRADADLYVVSCLRSETSLLGLHAVRARGQ